MRPTSVRPPRPLDLRRQLERLDRLPIRPASARAVIDAPTRDGLDSPLESSGPSLITPTLDPGWSLASLGANPDPLAIVAGSSWWKIPSTAGAEAIGRLWRHAVAVSIAARRLARDDNDPDPEAVARAGLLHRIGLWALAAIDPDRLAVWLSTADAEVRRERERDWYGVGLDSIGQTLAERWGCDRLTSDATWLIADVDGELTACADDPVRLRYLQLAHIQAEQTPWSLAAVPSREPGPLSPKIRLLMAEVQSRCGSEFVHADATDREERLTRQNASLRIETAELRTRNANRDRLIAALADSDVTDRPEVWADRAGFAWCDTPGVAAARVVWTDPTSSTEPSVAPRDSGVARPATLVVPIGRPGRPDAEIQLWEAEPSIKEPELLAAWGAWAALVGERSRLRRKLDAAIEAYRVRVDHEDERQRDAKLDALGEFAAGAGHELNNPLAVILGRAQLLLPQTREPDGLRSLQAIIVQAQRAHRILRDLMYVARPTVPRPKLCSADEILRASIRDVQAEADARGVRIVRDVRSSTSVKVWTDPDPLRHLADILLRNALEATPTGGTISVGSTGDDQSVKWTIKDDGRGLTAHEASHLFDPFFCGRQAGRGLGLGLPRAARIVESVGGGLTWQSSPGQGASFQLQFPVESLPPCPMPVDRAKSA